MSRQAQSALEEEIRKAQSKFDQARKRNQQLKSSRTLDPAVSSEIEAVRSEFAEDWRETDPLAQSAAGPSGSPAPYSPKAASPELNPQEERESYGRQSFSPEPGLIEELKSHSNEAQSPPPDPSPIPPVYPAYQHPYPMLPPQMYSAPQFCMPMLNAPVGYPPQFDMQGYARQMVEFFQQFVGGQGGEVRRLEEELEGSQREIEKLKGETRGDLRLTELTAEVDTLQKRVMSTEEELSRTQRERDELMTQLELGDHFPSEKEEEVTELRRRLADSLERTAALERTVAREREMRGEAERRAEVAKGKLGKAERACEELKIELKNMQEEATASTQELSFQLQKSQREVESLRRTHTDPASSTPVQSPETEGRPVARGKESLQRRATYTSRDNPQTIETNFSSQRGSPDLRKSVRSSTESLHSASARSAKLEQVKGVESQLMKLQIERDMALVEFNKLPEHSRTQAQRRRREELDRELEHYTCSMNSLKLQLRALASKV